MVEVKEPVWRRECHNLNMDPPGRPVVLHVSPVLVSTDRYREPFSQIASKRIGLKMNELLGCSNCHIKYVLLLFLFAVTLEPAIYLDKERGRDATMSKPPPSVISRTDVSIKTGLMGL